MFEIDGGMTVKHYRFVDWSEVGSLSRRETGGARHPAARFGLTNGREYRTQFVGPLFSDEGMLQERRLAAYLRGIAPRFASAPESRAA
jgi:hypothetical protein